MKKVNKYGLEIKGLKKCSGACLNWPAQSGVSNHIYYDVENGEIWQRTVIGENWISYEDPAVLLVATTNSHATMQQLADWVKAAMDQIKTKMVGDFYPWDIPF